MNQHQKIVSEFDRQYEFLADAVAISPASLAHRVFEEFVHGDEDPQIQYTSLEHLKHMARVYLAKRKDADGDESEAYAQAELDLGMSFSGRLQDRYPLPRTRGEEPVYKLRSQLTDEEVEWNAVQLEKAGFARLQHADALRAERQMKASA